MCNPIAAAIVLTAAGTGAQYLGQQRAEQAQENTLRRFDKNQGQIEGEARAVAERTRKLYENGTPSIADAASKRIAAYRESDQRNITPNSNEVAIGTGNQRVLGAVQAARAKGSSAARSEGERRANVNSLGDFLTNAALTGQRNSQDLSVFGNMAAGNRAILPLQLNAAAGKGNNLRTLGQLLSAAGAIAAPMAGSSAGTVPPPAAPKVAAPALSFNPAAFDMVQPPVQYGFRRAG